MLKTILSLPEKDEALINHMKELGIEDEDLINQTSILVKQIEKAKLGDSTAVQFIRDTVGEKPVDKVQANVFNYEESLKAVGGDEY